MRPEAQTILSALVKDFDTFQDTVFHWDDYDKATYADLLGRAEILARSDAAAASIYQAKLASVIGDAVQVERWCRNLELNKRLDLALHMRFHHYVNQGYASKGQEILPAVFAQRGDANLMSIARGALAVGAFSTAINAIDAAEGRQEKLMMTTLIDKIRPAHAVITDMGISDYEIGKMFDQAGHIIREGRMNWSSNNLSIIALSRSEGGPAMSVEWPIMVTPDEAARLTWQLTDRLVDHDLDRPGFSLGFIGLDIE